MGEPLVRPATGEDLPALVQLLGELFAIESDFAPNPDKQRAGLALLLQDPGSRVLVAEQGNKVLGMATVQTTVSTAAGGPAGLLEDVVVAAQCRGQGLGRLLIQEAVRWARSRGLRRLQLLADRGNAPALGFYGRLGFCQTQLVALSMPLC